MAGREGSQPQFEQDTNTSPRRNSERFFCRGAPRCVSDRCADTEETARLNRAQSIRISEAVLDSLAVVLVVAAPPEVGLVATEWRAVEPLVHAPEDVYPALVCRVCVVHDAVLERERAHAGPFSPVRRPVGSNTRC